MMNQRSAFSRWISAPLVLLVATSGLASPTDDYRAGEGFAINMVYASGSVSGILSFPVEFFGEGWTEVGKSAGSLDGSLDLGAIAPGLGLNAHALMSGTILGPTTLQWSLSAPDLIDQYVDISYGGMSYHVKVKSVSGTLTADALARFPTSDPVTGAFRNVDLAKKTDADNVLVMRGQLNGSFLLPVTVTLDTLEYEGLAGYGPDQVVSGTVELGDYLGTVTGTQVVLELREPGSVAPLETHVVSLDAQGRYSFSTARWGLHDLRAQSSHWLAQTIVGVNLDGAQTDVGFSLLNGDVDGDNAITVFDYNGLSDAFDSSEGDPTWNAQADLDGDGAVTVFDYNILSANFDLVGDD